jgi:hypothetical protein
MLPPHPADGSEDSGKVYHFAASKCIHDGDFSGAPNDIDKPAVAHALWEAAVR